MNRGIVPDGDLDICTYYGQDWKLIARSFESRGYGVSKVIVNDMERQNALYMGLNHATLPHICLSFWYPHNGVRYYCHDQNHELHGEGVPASGYFFKGIRQEFVDGDEKFAMVEWPGVPGSVRVRVPRFPGFFLDGLYPSWAYHKQRYNAHYIAEEDKMVSIHKGGAISEYMVHVKSMAEFSDNSLIEKRLSEGRKQWLMAIKKQKA